MEYYDWDYMFARSKEQWSPSLYVGNLDRNVTDSDLYDLFCQLGLVVSVHHCRDTFTNISVGYGYVFFTNHLDAERALKRLNFISVNGKSIRVMYYGGYNPNLIGIGHIFIKNLDKSIDHEALYNIFSCFGFILRSKVATDASGQSKGFGFVRYDNEQSAHKAVERMNGVRLNDKKIYVGPFLQRASEGKKNIFVNVVVKKLPKHMTEEQLNAVFQKFGPTTSCVIKINDQGRSKRFGYVNFVNPEDAAKAVEALNGKKIGYYKEWFVSKSRKKYEATAIQQRLKYIVKRSQRNNLCVVNLGKCVTDQNLSDFFCSYGTITSCKVMRDSSGVSKGSGFVVFSKSEEASKVVRPSAIMEDINREMKIIKQFYVNLAISLANATPQQQRTMLGENLYPMVEQLEPESASKITGMILEMDQTKVLNLIESFVALESKVAEATAILRTVKEQQQQYKGGSDTKSFLSPSFISPKPSSQARVNNCRSMREKWVVLLTNRFDSLKGVGE